MKALRLALKISEYGGKSVVFVAISLYVWHSGRTWRADYTGPRHLQRHVRASLQSAGTVLFAALLWKPLGTVLTVSAIVTALAVVSFFTRRQAAAQRAKSLRVQAYTHYQARRQRSLAGNHGQAWS